MTEWRRLGSPYRNYEVSDDGRVRRGGRELVGHKDRQGYHRVGLSQCGMSRNFRVHRLVCEAFHGPCPEGRECGHLDGNHANNRADNLAWITRAENARHNIEHGKHGGGAFGSDHGSAKLTEAIVREARARFAAGESGRKLAREFGVTSANMSAALRGDTWPHVSRSDAPTLSAASPEASPTTDGTGNLPSEQDQQP